MCKAVFIMFNIVYFFLTYSIIFCNYFTICFTLHKKSIACISLGKCNIKALKHWLETGMNASHSFKEMHLAFAFTQKKYISLKAFHYPRNSGR